MAYNYYDATGVLVLDQVTPVIKALFGAFKLDADYPGDGEVYIAKIAEDNDPTWMDVREGLVDFATSNGGIAISESATDEAIIKALLGRYGCNEYPALFSIDEYDSVEPSELFELARILDDGHGLRAIKFEGCWHCSKPRLFEFGGSGSYIGLQYSGFGSSNDPIAFGHAIDKALVANDTVGAAAVIRERIERLLDGVVVSEKKDRLVAALADVITLPSGAGNRYFAVTGRIPFDDEDTTHFYHVETVGDAVAAFEDDLYDEDQDASQENNLKEHGAAVYITNISESATEIRPAR